jgi:hypothetical protein
MFLGKGKLHYNDEDGFRLVANVGQELSDYYRSLIPSYCRAKKPGWPAHITVVRPEKEIPPLIRYWDNYEGEEIELIYDSYILEGNGYYWLNCWSKRLETIRTELGLPNISKYSLMPTEFCKTFHITIGKYEEIFDNNPPPEP